MKNLKKALIVFLVTIMASTMLVSCGGPKTSPEESTKIFLDVVLKDDKTNMDKIGVKEEEFNKFKKYKEDETSKIFENAGIDNSILTDEIKTSFKDSILKGLAKVDYEVTPVSTDKDTAKVEVKIKAFDMEKIFADAQNKVTQDAISNPSITEKEIYQKLFNLVGDAIASGTVKEQPKTVTITLTKESNVWMPNDDGLDDIMKAIMGE